MRSRRADHRPVHRVAADDGTISVDLPPRILKHNPCLPVAGRVPAFDAEKHVIVGNAYCLWPIYNDPIFRFRPQWLCLKPGCQATSSLLSFLNDSLAQMGELGREFQRPTRD